jgi:hypothetical protein
MIYREIKIFKRNFLNKLIDLAKLDLRYLINRKHMIVLCNLSINKYVFFL